MGSFYFHIQNLYEQFPDGFIIDNELRIPIEIKSRLPKIFDKLNSFYEKASSIWQNTDDYNLIIELEIRNISKQIGDKTLDSEIEYIKNIKNESNFYTLILFAVGKKIYRKNESIEYILTIYCRKTKNSNSSIYQQHLENYIYYSNSFRI